VVLAGAQPSFWGLSGDVEMLTGALRRLQINRVDFVSTAFVVELQLRSVGGSEWGRKQGMADSSADQT